MAAEVGDKPPKLSLPTDAWDSEVLLSDATRERPGILFFHFTD